MKCIAFLSAVLIILASVSCTKEKSFERPVTRDTAILNIAYGKDTAQTFDAYLPANRSSGTTKVIILIHGGSWVGGDKSDLILFVDTIKARFPRYAIFNLNYRLAASPNNLFPTQENDVNAAITFIYNNANTKYIISNKYVLIGVSAGAHLAMLQGFKYTSPVVPKVIADFSGPSDLTDMYNNPQGGNALISRGLAYVTGATPTSNPTIYSSSSPVNYITNTSPATIIFQGGMDPLVSVSQATAVQSKLTSAGVVNQYVFYQNQGHIGSWDVPTMLDAFNQLQAFLQTNVL